jgi:ethanolamine utilization microcompartment shell protein EutL
MTIHSKSEKDPSRINAAFSIPIASIETIPIPLEVLFARYLATAQALDQALKTANNIDLVAFVPKAEQRSYSDVRRR